jgi:hypothetical protein
MNGMNVRSINTISDKAIFFCFIDRVGCLINVPVTMVMRTNTKVKKYFRNLVSINRRSLHMVFRFRIIPSLARMFPKIIPSDCGTTNCGTEIINTLNELIKSYIFSGMRVCNNGTLVNKAGTNRAVKYTIKEMIHTDAIIRNQPIFSRHARNTKYPNMTIQFSLNPAPINVQTIASAVYRNNFRCIEYSNANSESSEKNTAGRNDNDAEYQETACCEVLCVRNNNAARIETNRFPVIFFETKKTRNVFIP